MKTIATLVFVLSMLANVQAQMPPINLTPEDLPFKVEGRTTGDEVNILSRGGIHIDVDLRRDIHGPVDRRQQTIEPGQPYMLRIKTSKGRSFDDGRRMVDDLFGPKSQVIMHFPGSVEISGSPEIYVDGSTVSQEMIHTTWQILGFGMPAAAPIGSFLTSLTINAIAGAIGDRAIDKSYENFLASEKIEITDGLEFGDDQEIKQVVWQVGGWGRRDHLSIQTAEIFVPVKFTEDGNYDLSLYFNVWGRHTYNPRNPMSMTRRGVFHSFRQQVVLGVEVGEHQASIDTSDTPDMVFFKNPGSIQKVSSQVITNNQLEENPSQIAVDYTLDNQDIHLIIFQSSEIWQGTHRNYQNFLNEPQTITQGQHTIHYGAMQSSGYNVFVTSGAMNMWQAWILLENNIIANVTGRGTDLDIIQSSLNGLKLRNYERIFNQRTNSN